MIKALILALALTSLIPAPHEDSKDGNVTVVYPGGQKYIYGQLKQTSEPAVVTDGNEEDTFFAAKAAKEQKDKVNPFNDQLAGMIGKLVSKEPVPAKETPKTMRPELTSMVLFDFDHAELKKTEESKLLAGIPKLKMAEAVEVKGFTDKIGPDQYNEKLATKRATSIKAFLVAHGINEAKISVEGKGKCCYTSTIDAENRRAELWFSEKQL